MNLILVNLIAAISKWFFPTMAQQPPSGTRLPYYRGFIITHRCTTVSRTPLDEWSARRRNLYRTTHNTRKKTDIHAPAGIRIHNLSKRAATDPSHWDSRECLTETVKSVEESTRIKSIGLSGNTVTEVVNETADDPRDQFRSNNKVFQAFSITVNETQVLIPVHCQLTSTAKIRCCTWSPIISEEIWN
jgi:hypothetical protein